MKMSFGSGTRLYGLSVRATNVLRNGEMVRENEAETRAVVREKVRTGDILRYRQCGKKTVREFERWLASECDETGLSSCARCAFWRRDEGVAEDSGSCRARAPVASVYGVVRSLVGDADCSANVAWWPETGALDWCGEFRRK